MPRKKVVCLLDMQRKSFAFPLQKLYSWSVQTYQRFYFNAVVLPTLKRIAKRCDLVIYTLDFKTDVFLKEHGIPFKSIRKITENLWDYDAGKKAMDYLKRLDATFTKHKISHSYDGIDLIDMTRKDVWRAYLLIINNLIDELHAILKKEKPDHVLVFNRTSLYQKILNKVAIADKIDVIDKTSFSQRAGEKLKKMAIRKIVPYNVPDRLRNPKAGVVSPRKKTGKRRILIIHNTIQPKKAIPWTKILAKDNDVTFIGINQNKEAFIEAGIDYQNALDYITKSMIGKMRGNREYFKENEPMLSKLTKYHPFVKDITYGRILLWDSLEELFVFFYHARFYEISCYIEIFKEIIRKEQPDIIVTVDDMSIYGRTLCRTVKQKKIPCIIVQPGSFAKTALFDASDAKKILVYGKSTEDNLVGSGIKKEQVEIVGIPEEVIHYEGAEKEVRSLLNIPKQKIFLFTSQGNPEGMNYPLFDTVYHAMKRIPEIAFVVKLHPAEKGNLHPDFIAKYGLKNVHIVQHGQIPLEKLLDSCHCLLNHYSTVGFEAIARGKYLISVNPTGLPAFMLPKPKEGLIMEARSYEELVKMIGIIAKKKPQPKDIMAASAYDVFAIGNEAAENAAKEISECMK